MRRRELIGGLLLAAAAGQTKALQAADVHRIAVVSPSINIADMRIGGFPAYSALFKELHRLGYEEGQNLFVTRRSGDGRTERYADIAREVVQLNPDLMFTTPNLMIEHFKAATATIPIVGIMADPSATGLVASLARPGRNITGVSIDAGIEVWTKRLGLLKETVPHATRVGLLASKSTWDRFAGLPLRRAADLTGVSLIGPPLEGALQETEYRRVFEAMRRERVTRLL
jgi:putative ABC transport system substrate-binding protein